MAEYCMECQRWGSYCRCRAIGRRAIEKHEASHPTPPAPPSREAVVKAIPNAKWFACEISDRDEEHQLTYESVCDIGVHVRDELIKHLAALPAREPDLDAAAGKALDDLIACGLVSDDELNRDSAIHAIKVCMQDARPAIWPVGQRVPATEDEMARVEAFNAGTGPAPEPRGAAETLLDAAIEVCKLATSGDENDHFAESFEAPFERLRAAAEQARKETAAGTTPAWIPCPCCEDFWCTLHNMHAYECKCPPVEEWKDSPYKSGGSADREEAAGT